MHVIRKTVATVLFEVNPAAAQFALGHTTDDVTKKRYVCGKPRFHRQGHPVWTRRQEKSP